ncbi:histidine phosphatase family protein [Sulfobacillus thermosulfidooxidans]|uniref:histidine phosphatase family protein n=1 Tax=Sulfobacillus thermosulfidooxidans TaxID=28034 RepID=UPI0006B5B0F5|nr:histidine phosphatase family protein [Sulfobacillus thermosulfidooxidans]
MECYVIRHAETVLNRKNVLQGWADAPLSDNGMIQAMKLAGVLPSWPIFSSDLKRALHTAELFAVPGQRIQPDARLREIHVGVWQGLSKERLRHTSLWQRYQRSPSSFRFPGGESLKDLQYRIVGAFQEYQERLDHFIIVSHRLAIKSLLCHLQGWSLDQIHQIDLPNAAVLHIYNDCDDHQLSIKPFILHD